jgi:hypothetical protein
MLGLAPSISCERFSGLRYASPEHDEGAQNGLTGKKRR